MATEDQGELNPVGDMLETFSKASDQMVRFWDKVANRPTSAEDPSASVMTDFSESFKALGEVLVSDPNYLAERQMDLMKSQMSLWQQTALKYMGQESSDVVVPEKGDRRFKDSEWSENILFDYIKQYYLLQSKSMLDCVEEVEGLEEHAKKKVEFFTRQFVNALSPSNFPGTNPEVVRKVMETGGANLVNGMEQLLEDLDQSANGLNITMTDTSAFKVGRNVATTPGEVVFENDLMQLIQLTPSTPKVLEKPLLVIPPFINKYYIMDLREKNSLLKWLVDEGHTVFVVSWVNPGPQLRDKDFNSYMQEGPLAALDAIEKATGATEVNAMGYCLGGTLLAATLAYMAEKKDKRIVSATYLATLLDFSDPGEIGVFINETAISALERQMNLLGYYDGRQMAFSFNMLRENDLFWSFFINNYLKGERPAAFDLLYWNSDGTNLPAAMHSFYLRNMYLNNLLKEKDGIELDGVKIDLSKVKVPTYFLSAAQDHIAKWKTTYAGTQFFSGKNRFVLGGSGHIAGVINPPSANKYGYWVNEELPADPDDWFKGAKQNDGSWWLDWQSWAKPQAGKMVASRKPGAGKLKVIETAPGRYVQQKIKDVVKM